MPRLNFGETVRTKERWAVVNSLSNEESPMYSSCDDASSATTTVRVLALEWMQDDAGER